MAAYVLVLSLTLSCCQGYNKNIPLLKDTLDMAYEIIKLIKMSPKKGKIPPKKVAFPRQMERDFYVYDMDSPTLKII